MSFINNVISEQVINAVGWTILHSIWQGAAVALGFAILMFFLRRYSSRTRYFVGVMALLLVLGISLTTFINIYDSGTIANIPPPPEGISASALSGTSGGQNLDEPGIFLTFKEYFNRHMPLIVTLWFLGILVFVLKLTGGFLYNQRVKSHQTQPLDKFWQNHLQKLRLQAGIKKPVRLLEAALVKVPMTIGHLKPVILLPVGMITGMPRDQVEALLAHELAHILRRDYLVNIMQNVIDILYFYHPAVKWLSSHVRAERENCCDDIAVSLSGDSLNFARALSNIGGSAAVYKANPALTAAGKRSLLLSRIKRLFAPRKKGGEFTEGFIGACIMVLFVLTLFVSANAAAGLNRGSEEAVKTGQEDLIQTVNENEEIAREENAERAIVEEKVEEEKKEQEKKEEESEKKKEEIAREKVEKLRKEVEKRERELRAVEREKLSKLRTELRKAERELRAIEREKFDRFREEHRKQERELREEDREKLERFREEFRKQERELREEDRKKLAKLEDELRKKVEKMAVSEKEKVAKIEKQLQQRAQELEAIKREKIEKIERELQERAEELREKEKEHEEQEAFINDLKKDLKKDKLIDDEEDYEFKLTPRGLWINGKKQSKKVFKKYKQLFESRTGKKIDDMKQFRIVHRK